MSATWLTDLPLNKLSAVTPLSEKLLLESRCPLAQILWFPSPVFVPDPAKRSALTPGLSMANWVKLPVPSGVLLMVDSFSTYPIVEFVWLTMEVPFTSTVSSTVPTLSDPETVVVRSACTRMSGWLSERKPPFENVTV